MFAVERQESLWGLTVSQFGISILPSDQKAPRVQILIPVWLSNQWLEMKPNLDISEIGLIIHKPEYTSLHRIGKSLKLTVLTFLKQSRETLIGWEFLLTINLTLPFILLYANIHMSLYDNMIYVPVGLTPRTGTGLHLHLSGDPQLLICDLSFKY